MITDTVLECAREVLTPIQLETWRLIDSGRSLRQVGMIRGVSRNAVREALHRAWTKLDEAGIKQNSNGDWYAKETKC